mgnify:CR=1 FL=1
MGIVRSQNDCNEAQFGCFVARGTALMKMHLAQLNGSLLFQFALALVQCLTVNFKFLQCGNRASLRRHMGVLS